MSASSRQIVNEVNNTTNLDMDMAMAAQLETLRRLPAQTLVGMQIPTHVNLKNRRQ